MSRKRTKSKPINSSFSNFQSVAEQIDDIRDYFTSKIKTKELPKLKKDLAYIRKELKREFTHEEINTYRDLKEREEKLVDDINSIVNDDKLKELDEFVKTCDASLLQPTRAEDRLIFKMEPGSIISTSPGLTNSIHGLTNSSLISGASVSDYDTRDDKLSDKDLSMYRDDEDDYVNINDGDHNMDSDLHNDKYFNSSLTFSNHSSHNQSSTTSSSLDQSSSLSNTTSSDKALASESCSTALVIPKKEQIARSHIFTPVPDIESENIQESKLKLINQESKLKLINQELTKTPNGKESVKTITDTDGKELVKITEKKKHEFTLKDNMKLRKIDRISDKIVNYNLIIPRLVEPDICPNCCEPLIHSEEEAILSCTQCHILRPYIDTSNNTAQSYNSCARTNNPNQNNPQFEQILRYFDTESFVYIPNEVYELIKKEAKINGDEGEISALRIKDILRRNHIRQHYNDIVQIYSHLNGKKIPILTKNQKDLFHSCFKLIKIVYEKYKQDANRSSFLSYPLVFLKICKRLGFVEYTGFINVVKSSASLRQQESIFQKMCENELGWPYECDLIN